jgi:hypothetical protein
LPAQHYQSRIRPPGRPSPGVNLWTLLNEAGGVTVTAAKNDILSKYVVATGSDGYQAVFSLGEIDPNFGDQPIMDAYADIAAQLGPHGRDGLVRMVVPGDLAGERYVSELVDLLTSRDPAASLPTDAFRQGVRSHDRYDDDAVGLGRAIYDAKRFRTPGKRWINIPVFRCGI